jgi:hypothetical protein
MAAGLVLLLARLPDVEVDDAGSTAQSFR